MTPISAFRLQQYLQSPYKRVEFQVLSRQQENLEPLDRVLRILHLDLPRVQINEQDASIVLID